MKIWENRESSVTRWEIADSPPPYPPCWEDRPSFEKARLPMPGEQPSVHDEVIRPAEPLYGKGCWHEMEPADLIETCRAYLLMAANKAVGSELRVKVAPSDLVQDTMIAAVQNFEQFNGSSERELLAWLTKILSYRVVDAARKFRRQKADVTREVSIDDEARVIELSITGRDGTPSELLMAEEEERRLMAAMKKLSSEDAELVRLRNWEQLTFDEIGQRIGLSESGARKRWAQAVQELRRRMGQ